MATAKKAAPSSSPPAGPASSTGDGSSGEGYKLIQWTNLETVTSFSPHLLQQMARLKMLRGRVEVMLERMRRCAQPNELFRRDRLVPSAVHATSDRALFVETLRDCASACFDNMPPLTDYTNQLATLENTIDRAHDTFLRRVVLYSVKPLQKFMEDYNRIAREYELLEKALEAYDKERRKTKSGTLEANPKLADRKQKLLERANSMAAILREVAETQILLATYVDSFIRAEAGFFKVVEEETKRMKHPAHRKRWPDKYD